MNRLSRRNFLFGISLASLPLVSSANSLGKPKFRVIMPDENVFAVGETVPLRVFTKTAFPRFHVDFKVNGQSIGTAYSFPYQINWIPTQTGNYNLTAEISAPQMRTTLDMSVSVLNLLYDAIGRRGVRFYDGESSYSSLQTLSAPEIIFGLPVNFAATLKAPRTIRRIDAVLSATTYIRNILENMPFPTNYNFVAARIWNNGLAGFQSSPRTGSLSNTNIGAPNSGSTTVPVTTNSQGIKYYLLSWANLNIVLPPSVPLALAIHFSHSSSYDFTERISFARSNLPGQNLLYAGGYPGSNAPLNISGIGASSIRIWTD
jgi:hypothetical protein